MEQHRIVCPSWQQKKRPVPIILCLAFFAFLLLASGCNSKSGDGKKTTADSATNAIAGISQLKCVIMTPDDITKALEQKENETGQLQDKFSKILFRFSFTGLSSDAPVFSLVAYKTRYHEEYGYDERANPLILREATTCETPLDISDGEQYIFGNNEITVEKIKRLAAKPGGGYNYLVFTPKHNATTKQVYFEVTPAASSGKKIIPADLQDDTNPTPPGRPGT